MAQIPNPKENFKEYQQALFKALVSATAAANQIPTEDLGFYRSLDRQFAKNLDTCGSRLLQIANSLLDHCAKDTGVEAPSYDDVDDVTDRYRGVIEVVDGLLERADFCVDEMTGRRQGEEASKPPAPELTQVSTKVQQGKLEYKLLHATNVVRPQLKFKDHIDNSPNTVFMRKITVKPHAMVPLDYGVTPDMLGNEDELPTRSLPHPYEYEINHITYPDHMFVEHEPVMYEPFDTTSFIWVETDEQLGAMMNDLANVQELAIDLEHHNYRSFQGFTCLMQISTRDQDYLVDTLELRDRLWQLNEYFANPNIVKVLHGAESDIIWLQRDFGLYIVNLFDTYHATKVLEFPQHSLAFLLRKYCSVDADKKYQLADWRIRPLPEEMLKYARSDTHYLLYIYDCLRNELLQKSGANQNLLRAVLQRSNVVALQKYEKEGYDAEQGTGPSGWAYLKAKWKHPMTSQQFAVFKALHQWRDHTAREEDESLRYVLPNHMLFALVERMPTDSAGVIGCCNPCPPLVRMNAQAIAVIIQKAKIGALTAATAGLTLTATTDRVDSANKLDRPVSLVPVKPKVATVPSKKAKRVKETVDPIVFDLDKVNQARTAALAAIAKSSSSLFGENGLSATSIVASDDEKAPLELVEKIKASLKLTLPFEGLKVKAVKVEQQTPIPQVTTAPPPAASSAAPMDAEKEESKEPEELLYVPPEERSTKKRKEADERADDVVVLRETLRKKKKKSKNKSKQAETTTAENRE